MEAHTSNSSISSVTEASSVPEKYGDFRSNLQKFVALIWSLLLLNLLLIVISVTIQRLFLYVYHIF